MNLKDDFLEQVINTYKIDKFLVTETTQIISLKNVDLFVIDHDNVESIGDMFMRNNLRTNFEESHL